jgi:hypothetical protein
VIQIRCDIEAFKSIYTNVEHEQLPFAASLALNNTAKGAQSFVREGERANFTIRRDWVLMESVKISHFSTKREDPMYARIQVGDKADFMEKFESGTTKTSRTGGNIAVPIMARPSRGGLVPDSLRPKNLNLHAVGGAIRGDQRTFMLTTRSGRKGIFQRIGNARSRRLSKLSGSFEGDVVLLYWLTPSVPTPATLHFEERVKEAVTRLWAQEFERAFEQAMETAR